MGEVVLQIVESREGMIKALFQSRMTRSVLGVKSRMLGPGTYFTTVKEIQLREDDEVLVQLAGYDMTGYVLDKSEVNLSDIDYVVPLTALFENPYVREVKKNIDLVTGRTVSQ